MQRIIDDKVRKFRRKLDLPPVSVGAGHVKPVVVQSGPGQVAIVDVDGLILNTPFVGPLSCGENPVGLFREKLEAIVPRFLAQLPNDLLSGEPYKYRRNGVGQFILYSIGCDEKDDGGVPGKTLFDEASGDWVWDSSASGDEAGSSKQ